MYGYRKYKIENFTPEIFCEVIFNIFNIHKEDLNRFDCRIKLQNIFYILSEFIRIDNLRFEENFGSQYSSGMKSILDLDLEEKELRILSNNSDLIIFLNNFKDEIFDKLYYENVLQCEMAASFTKSYFGNKSRDCDLILLDIYATYKSELNGDFFKSTECVALKKYALSTLPKYEKIIF